MSYPEFPPLSPPNHPRQPGVTQPTSALYLYKTVTEESAYDDQNNALPSGWIRGTVTQTWTTFVNHQTGQQQSTSPMPRPADTVSLPTPPTIMTQNPDKMPVQAPFRRRRRPRNRRKSASSGANDNPRASHMSQTLPALDEENGFDIAFKAWKSEMRDSKALDAAPTPDPTLDTIGEPAAPPLDHPSDFAQTATDLPSATTSNHPAARVHITDESKGSNKRPLEDCSAGSEGAEAELPAKKLLRQQ